MKLAQSATLRVAFACLPLAFCAQACADQANPVIPSTTNIPGGRAGGTLDAAAGEAGTNDDIADRDTADRDTANRDTQPTSDATIVVCQLLKQDCPKDPINQTPRGCYPVSGVGRCETPGVLEFPSSCTGELGQQECAAGFICEPPSSSVVSAGLCEPLCDFLDATGFACPQGQVCQLLSGVREANVGRCITP